MKALVLHDNKLVMENDRPIPEPEEDEIRVKVACCGLNPVDYKLMSGWGDPGWKEPPVLGLDVSGVVDKVGIGVEKFKVGDRVYYHGSLAKINGGFAEYACTTALTVSLMDDKVGFEVAAAVPCSGFTAYQATMDKLKLDSTKTVLIQAGAGGVGGYAIQLAKHKGAMVITTCSARNDEYVRSLGADYIVHYGEDDIEKSVMEITGGRGVDYAVDTVGGETATQAIDYLAFSGQLVCIVDLPDFNRIRFFEKGISIHEVALGGAHINGDTVAKRHLAEIGDDYMRLLADGSVKPPKMQIISLEQVAEYMKLLETRHVSGKIVARIG